MEVKDEQQQHKMDKDVYKSGHSYASMLFLLSVLLQPEEEEEEKGNPNGTIPRVSLGQV